MVVTIDARALAALLAEHDRLRAQVDELQADNTRLQLARQDAEQRAREAK